MKLSYRAARAVILGFFFTSSAITSTSAAIKKNQPLISRISIRGTDVFDLDTNVSLNKFPYSQINFLHIKTNESVVANELLFKVGDRLDPFLIDETERNLRALPFIRAARVAKFPQRDGTVALVVHVNDAWTTEPQINVGGINKVDTTEFGFKEKNLLGMGKTVGVFYKKSDHFIQREYTYTDPRLLGSRWQLRGHALSKTDGHSRTLTLERPFYAADTKWSARTLYDRDISTIDEFSNSVRVSRFEQTKETSEAAMGIKVGGGRDLVNHAGLRYQTVNRDFARTSETAAGRTIPDHDDLQTIFLDIDSTHNDFIKATHLEKMTRVEDLNLGPIFQLSPGLSPHAINTKRSSSTQFAANLKKRKMSQKGHLLDGEFGYSGRNTFENGENQRYNFRLKYYFRASEMQTMVLNTRADWGDNLDPDNQVKLGGDNGLRAFKVDDINGTKGWVLNAEDRLFLTDELWNLLSIGAVVFYDTGFVWARGEPVALHKLKSAVGVGLRFGLTRSSNEVILRLDFAYRTQRINSNDPKFVVIFGTGQAF